MNHPIHELNEAIQNIITATTNFRNFMPRTKALELVLQPEMSKLVPNIEFHEYTELVSIISHLVYSYKEIHDILLDVILEMSTTNAFREYYIDTDEDYHISHKKVLFLDIED